MLDWVTKLGRDLNKDVQILEDNFLYDKKRPFGNSDITKDILKLIDYFGDDQSDEERDSYESIPDNHISIQYAEYLYDLMKKKLRIERIMEWC